MNGVVDVITGKTLKRNRPTLEQSTQRISHHWMIWTKHKKFGKYKVIPHWLFLHYRFYTIRGWVFHDWLEASPLQCEKMKSDKLSLMTNAQFTPDKPNGQITMNFVCNDGSIFVPLSCASWNAIQGKWNSNRYCLKRWEGLTVIVWTWSVYALLDSICMRTDYIIYSRGFSRAS